MRVITLPVFTLSILAAAAQPADAAVPREAVSGLAKRTNNHFKIWCPYVWLYLNNVCANHVPDAYIAACLAGAQLYYADCCADTSSNGVPFLGDTNQDKGPHKRTVQKRDQCPAQQHYSGSTDKCNQSCDDDRKKCFRSATYGSIPDANGAFRDCDDKYFYCCYGPY